MIKITPGPSPAYKLRRTGIGAIIIFIIAFFASAGTAFSAAADTFEQTAQDFFNGYDDNGGGRRVIKFSRVVGMVYDIRSSRGLKNCEIRVGKVKTRTDANGYFEIPSMLYDEYIITAVLPPYERHIDVLKINSPLKAVKIYLETPAVKISETKKANLEYDRLLARIMKGSVNQISINGDDGARRKKPSYSSKYGRKQMIEEDAQGRKYSKKSSGEVSKAPHISADKGFGLLICSVFESSGAEIEGNARILIATQAVETLKSRPVEIHNVPVGIYKITVKCEGYADKVYDKVAVKPGKNERNFFIDKAKK